jgi:chromosome segregation ATPase
MEMALDIVIIIMIAVMISFAVILNAKLKRFRNAQNEMAALVAQLNGAITRAQSSVETLKKTAQTEEGRLKDLVVKSRLLADELSIITESGTNLADRIERGLVPVERLDDDTDAETEYEEESEMLETLKKVR